MLCAFRSDSSAETTNPWHNTILKASFKLLHEVVVPAITPASNIIDHLYASCVLSDSQQYELAETNLNPRDRSRRLLSVLHKSGNPRSFVQLRLALSSDPAHSWLVDRIDEKCSEIIEMGVNAIRTSTSSLYDLANWTNIRVLFFSGFITLDYCVVMSFVNVHCCLFIILCSEDCRQ